MHSRFFSITSFSPRLISSGIRLQDSNPGSLIYYLGHFKNVNLAKLLVHL